MRNTQRAIALFAVLLLSPFSSAQSSSTSRSEQQDSLGKGSPCLFEFERGVVPDCIQKGKAGKLFVAPQYVKELDFDSGGLAPIRSEAPPYGWMYVNRRGVVVIIGVPTWDNWADEFHDGLVRIVKSGKVGFANRKGDVVIPPIYDWAWPFENGVATVCNGCHLEECLGEMSIG